MKDTRILLLRLFAAFALGAILAFALCLTGSAEAHNGGLSPKDQCHNDNQVGERHWHIADTTERGGLCEDGKQLGNCETKRNDWAECVADRWCFYESEAKRAQEYIECFEGGEKS